MPTPSSTVWSTTPTASISPATACVEDARSRPPVPPIRAPRQPTLFRYVTLWSRPMPRTTLGDKPMTNAQRQARYRLARAAARPVIHYRRAADRRSRAQRWRDAVAELVALQSEYARWFEALPDPLHDTATGEALQAIVDL